MSTFREFYEADLARYGGKVPAWTRCFHFFLRKTAAGSRFLRGFYHLCFRLLSDQHRMEISYGAKIGKGLCLRDPFTVTVNSNTVIGEDVTLGKNVTIGKQNRGKYAGSPTIGSRVEIGDNAVVVGKITIGNDVRIAAKSYVNRDVPEGAFVSGNPASIVNADHAVGSGLNS